ncbi:tetratricopeptide repeat protein [Polaribacter sp. MSW13]|uniref:Tetratricopeptide repeat protein n=1 Tax=Polaribacter marinus TaxID=2916838 RepID=A0A9X2AKE0_9FLAO|nr:tetratricopeptide repeat-containing sensor histidine kinase [Polaribacter marinus]MCI2229423.1 tetratricopeptide repeat protein [Polaribacter marinus]
MYKKTTLFIYFILFSTFVFSQENKDVKDSISFYLKSFKENKDLNLLKKAVLIAEPTNLDSLKRELNIKYGIYGYLKKDTTSLFISQQNLLKLYLESKDSFALAKHYHYKALIFRLKFIKDSSFYYYHKSKKISINLKDSLEVARRLLSMARDQEMQRDYLGSEISSVEALKYIEPLNEIRYTANIYNNLGLVLTQTKRFAEARENFLIFKKLNDKKPTEKERKKANIDYFINVGLSYADEGKHKKAVEYYKQGLSIKGIETEYPRRYHTLTDNLAYSNFKLGNKTLALNGYKKALLSREKYKNLYGQSISHSLLSNFYIFYNDKQKALFHAKKGLQISLKIHNSRRILENLKYLSQLTKGEKGKQYLMDYIQLSDSITKRERNLKNQFAKIRYETEKKDKENNSLKEENNKKQLLLESEKQQKIIGWLIAGVSILFIGFGISIVSNRRKKLLFEAKLQQVEVRENERQQIAKSLHDEVAGDIRMLHLKLSKANQLDEAEKLNVIKENVRTLSHQLSSESFEMVSFKDQIINLISDYFDVNFKIKVEGIDNVNWLEVNNAIKRTLFLSIRESIQNTKKHAEADQINITFSETKKAIFLVIFDNGKGFDVEGKKNGIGLKNLRERIVEINGVFSLESKLEIGTTIKIETPKNGN